MTRIIGIDPGLTHTGWGVIDQNGNRLQYVACGRISAPPALAMADRLHYIFKFLQTVFSTYQPHQAALEETFVNSNPRSALILGQARGAIMLATSYADLPLHEYAANTIKKTVVGAGHADKQQVQHMVNLLLPGARAATADAADALAVAICDAHHATAPKISVRA